MIDIPNCSTCPKEHTKKCPIDFEKCHGNSDIYNGMRRVTDNCLMGCHPDAPAYLMAPVIQELERLYDGNAESGTYTEGKADGYDRAITLIRDGVKV